MNYPWTKPFSIAHVNTAWSSASHTRTLIFFHKKSEIYQRKCGGYSLIIFVERKISWKPSSQEQTYNYSVYGQPINVFIKEVWILISGGLMRIDHLLFVVVQISFELYLMCVTYYCFMYYVFAKYDGIDWVLFGR